MSSMSRQMLRAKIHRIAVTEKNVEYDGSLTLDTELMRAADLRPFERIEVYDIDNGNRFATYVIEGRAGTGVCCVNGAAAHMVEEGHKVIIAAYCDVPEEALERHQPIIVLMGERNRIRHLSTTEQAGVARSL